MQVQRFQSPRPKPAYVNSVALLGGGAAKPITVPTGYTVAIFSYTAQEVYVRVGATATVPGDVSNGAAAELAPVAYRVAAGDVISLISAVDDCVVTVAFYYGEGGL